MKLNDVVRYNELFDVYGGLLTDYQRKTLSEFLKYNLTFSEIAENRNVSRQSTFILLNKCIDKLENYEAKVGAVKAKKSFSNKVSRAVKSIENGDINSALEILKKEA